MSNSGNTISKKMIVAIIIVAVLLIAAISAVVVFLRDQGETSAMAENNPQSAEAQENAQTEQNQEQDSQTQETAQQSEDTQTDENAGDNQETSNVEESTEVATNDGTTQSEQSTESTETTESASSTSGTTTSTTGSTNNASTTTDNTNNDANNIQESVIEEVQTNYTEERVKVEEGEILSWTPEALTTFGIAANMKLNAPNLVTTKTSVVIDDEGKAVEDQTKVNLTNRVKYTITIENVGNVAGTVKANNTFDTLPEGFNYSSTNPTDYAFSAQILDSEDAVVEAEAMDLFKDVNFEGLKATLNKDIAIEAGNKLVVEYTLKLNPEFLKDGEDLLANKDLAKNVITVNNLPVEDDKEYDAVQPLVTANKTSVILRGETVDTATEIAKSEGAKEGDFIKYTIHIENNGQADTTVFVKDKGLTNILADNKAEFVSGDKTLTDLENGFPIKLSYEAPNNYADINFVIRINNVQGEITNEISVVDTDIENPDPIVPETPDQVDTVDITGTKSVSPEGTVQEKDELTYTITLTNAGNKTVDAIVKDTIPGGLTFVAGSIQINGVAIDTAEKQYTTEDLANGISVNVPGNNGSATLSFRVTADILPEGTTSLEAKNTAIIDEEDNTTDTTETVINKAYVTLTINKNWVDNDIQDDRRPEKITFVVLANGEETNNRAEVDKAVTDEQSYTFENLPKYDENGNVINYSAKEVNAGEFYKSEVGTPVVNDLGNTEVEITNTFKLPDDNSKNVTVTKVWEDNNDEAGKRPENVTLTVTGNGKSQDATLTEANKLENDSNTWQTTVTMDKYNSDGQEITYTARENVVPNFYTPEVNGTTVINTFAVPTTTVDVKVNKQWVEDNEIQALRRPEQIKFTLTANGNTAKDENGNDITYVMNVTGNNQEYTFEDLPEYDEKADIIDYDVIESVIDGDEHKDDLKFYESTKTENVLNNIQFTNTFKLPENNSKKVTVTKKWVDNNDEAEKRPEQVVVNITGYDVDGTNTGISGIIINETNKVDDNTWEKAEINLQQYNQNGQEIEYNVTEEKVDFYTTSINGATITNTFGGFEQKTVNIPVTKVWVDNDNVRGKRPQNIVFQVTGNNVTTETTLSGTGNTWTGSVDVPKYDDYANEIEYSIDEVLTSKFYTKSINQETRTITNIFKVPEEDVNVTVNKTWEDNETQAKRRPNSIRFVLTENGTETDTYYDMEINEETNDYTYTFSKLDRYDSNGNEIEYGVNEKEISDGDLDFYTHNKTSNTVDEDGNRTIEIKNTFTLPKDNIKPITITKEWVDGNDVAGKRPEGSITLQLNGEDVVVNDNGTNIWTAQVNKPTYNENGETITYSVDEKDVPEFYEKTISADGMKVTNTFKAPTNTKQITIEKEWNDNNNVNRPTEVVFNVIGTAKNKEAYNESFTIEKDQNLNNWTKTITVPVFDQFANLITYRVEEANVPTGYIAEVDSTGLKITNSLPSIDVQKDVIEVKHKDGSVTNVNVPNSTEIAVEEGDIVKYQIVVTNTSDITIQDLVVSDNTLAVTKNPNGETDIISELGRIDNLVGGASRTYIVYHKVTGNEAKTAGVKITNTVTVTGNYNDGKDTITKTDDATVTIKDVNNISVIKEQKVNGKVIPNGTEVKLGTTINYTITVKNEGNTTLHDVVVNDTISGIAGELVFNNQSGITVSGNKNDGYVITIGTLNAGETKTITAKYTVIEGDISESAKQIANVATVNAKTPDDKPLTPPSSSVDVNTEEGEPIIDVTKTSKLIEKNGKTTDGKAEYGDIIVYTITATNTGIISGDVTITDKVPTGTELYRQGTTNLSAEELDALESEEGLTKVLNVPGNNGKATITFSVKVTAKPGEDVKNTATVNDGENETEKSDKGSDVEKTVKVTAKSQTTTIKNSNVVIVLDTSGSMNYKMTETVTIPCPGHRRGTQHGGRGTDCYQNEDGEWVVDKVQEKDETRLDVAKDVIQGFIDSMQFAEDGNGSAVSIVTFNGSDRNNHPVSGTGYSETLKVKYNNWWEEEDTIANTASEAEYLADTSLENVIAHDGTCISGSLLRAKQQMELLKANNPNNKNIVIFVGDGEPDEDKEENKITEYANNLKAIADTVYAIGFESDISILRNIASPGKYYTTDDNLDLSDVFTEVGSDLGDTEPDYITSNNGEITLTNIDTTKEVTLKVKTSTETDFTTTEALVSQISQIKQRTDGTYYLDVSEFAADAEIEITYVTVATSN